MKNTFGSSVSVTLFGESHGTAVGAVLDGMAPGVPVDEAFIARQLELRRPYGTISTARREADTVELVSGVFEGKTTGTPLCVLIRNTDANSADYAATRSLARPGHADYTAYEKYHGYEDYRGGGHFSGRLTAPLCIAGGIVRQELRRHNIVVDARIAAIAGIRDESAFEASVADKAFPVVDDKIGEQMRAAIQNAREDGDSVGGVIECVVRGLPVGVGEPMFDGVENQIARLVFAVPAVKGVEFGAGFEAAKLRGSENNDPFLVEDKCIRTASNHAGGILGGITNGMPLVFRVAVKPTPSISRAQQSVNLSTMEPQELRVTGRHDPCIVPRAVPVIEAAAALAVYDLILGESIWN